MKKYIFGAVLSLGILVTPAFTQAAGLTSSQINAIIGLLQSFGADQATINNVQISLNGGTPTGGGTQASGPIGDSSGCIYLTQALIVGSTDATTNGEVSKLQQFLVAAGVYPEARITGYYGLLTAQAVVRWQKAHGMDFVTTASGVGPMTRAKLQTACSNSSSISLPTTCTDQSEATPVITSISPVSGPIGTKVLIGGCNLGGFEGDLDAIFVRSDGAKIPLYGGTGTGYGKLMTVTVQSYCVSGSETGRYSGIVSQCAMVQATPGVYKVYVTAWGKKSNEATFTIK